MPPFQNYCSDQDDFLRIRDYVSFEKLAPCQWGFQPDSHENPTLMHTKLLHILSYSMMTIQFFDKTD